MPASAFIFQPTDGEPVNAEQLEPIVGHHPIAGGAIHRQDAHRPGRQVRLGQVPRHPQHRQWVLRGRLEDDAAARGDGRRHLVRGEVEREVERADAGHRADRVAAHDPVAAPVGRSPVERQPLSVDAEGLLGGGPEREGAASHLTACVADRLPGLARKQHGELVGIALDACCHVGEGVAARVARKAPRLVERGHGRGRGPIQLVGPSLERGGHERAVRRVAHLERRAGLDELACEVDRDRWGADLGRHAAILRGVSWRARSQHLRVRCRR